MVNLIDVATKLGITQTQNIEVSGVTHNTKNCGQGDIFVAIQGFQVDGNSFVNQAIEKGAVAIISEKP